MKKGASAILAMVTASVALVGCFDNDGNAEAPPWTKFVTEPGKAWLTNGVCSHSHVGKKHLVDADWHGAWIRIVKTPGSSDEKPEFSVEVSPGIPDKQAWDNLVLTYKPGNSSSDTSFPICSGSESSDAAAAATEKERLEGWIDGLTHTTKDGDTATIRHKVLVYLWKPATDPDGKTFGPLEIIFFHEAGGSHNGIVH